MDEDTSLGIGAISPIISVLILSITALVVGGLAYSMLTGMVGGMKPEALSVTAYIYPESVTFTAEKGCGRVEIYVLNEGSTAVTILGAKYRDITGGGRSRDLYFNLTSPELLKEAALDFDLAVRESQMYNAYLFASEDENDYVSGHLYEIAVITAKGRYTARALAE